MPRKSAFPPVPEPQRSEHSHQETLLALKEGYEVLTRQRNKQVALKSCPTWEELIELGVVSVDQVNLILK